jgi:hypothetical protein
VVEEKSCLERRTGTGGQGRAGRKKGMRNRCHMRCATEREREERLERISRLQLDVAEKYSLAFPLRTWLPG